jgi:bacterioferritin
MKAKEGVVKYLNQVLKSELTAVHQYLLHAALCKNWGYPRLHARFSHLATEEVGHSSKLIDHLLYLEGVPGVEHLDTVGGGRTVADLSKGRFGF